MEILRLVLLFVHILGFAALLGDSWCRCASR